jgi:hypothetical protein
VSDAPIIPPTPQDWGRDTLATFLDTARRNVIASFVLLRPQYQRLADIDAGFRLIAENLHEPRDWFVALFLLRTHSSYLGAAQLALAGQLPESYMLLRGSLENAIYAYYFEKTPDSHMRWLRRHDSAKSKRVVEDEFRIRALLRLLRNDDVKLGTIATRLYEHTIDYGAHPNERGLTQTLKRSEPDKGTHRLDVSYLTGGNKAMDLCLKSTARVGVCGLRVFAHVYPERYNLLGLTARLQYLEEGL